jgi:hypothetical protein
MASFEIQPILDSTLSDVACFLRRWRADRDREAAIERAAQDDASAIERRLRWLLLDSPLATRVSTHGFCVRDGAGTVRGLLVSFPAAFVAADQRLLALGSGGFFVEREARSLGFLLFKKHLRSRGFAFFFSTSCNAASAPLWKALGGCAVPNSDTEYVLPLRFDVMLPALVSLRSPSRAAAGLARVSGRFANPAVRLLARRAKRLAIEPCRDWEKLSELAGRHRPAGVVTTDRTPAHLAWRYSERSPNHPAGVFLFRDRSGNEGWFSLCDLRRGRDGRIRGRALLDAIWPRDRIDFRDLVPAIARQALGADAVFLQPRPGVDVGACSRWIVPRALEAPQAFAIAATGGAPPAASSLDLVPADGDSAIYLSRR